MTPTPPRNPQAPFAVWRAPATRAEPLEGAAEGVLRELPGQLVVARQAVGEAVDAVHMRVVEQALRGAVPGTDSGYQFAFVHRAPESVIPATRGVRKGLRGAVLALLQKD